MYSIASGLQQVTQSETLSLVVIYTSWITTHYIASQLYNEYCVNWSWRGYLMSPFTVTSPICKGLNWVVYESSNSVSSFFVFAGSSMALYLSRFKYREKEN